MGLTMDFTQPKRDRVVTKVTITKTGGAVHTIMINNKLDSAPTGLNFSIQQTFYQPGPIYSDFRRRYLLIACA
ncbi:MAG: hypothetical protein CM1200mP18_23550 [Gammaproteobacteria bacterium]|nr:MAG: hypothetical protein CM1200mP18_23550 [Gammaproteobacteria bacterium]